jgi:hypothetical protein
MRESVRQTVIKIRIYVDGRGSRSYSDVRVSSVSLEGIWRSLSVSE